MSDLFSLGAVVFFAQGRTLAPSSRTDNHVLLQVLVSQGGVEKTFKIVHKWGCNVQAQKRVPPLDRR
jgi:hypothetical protein